MRRSTALWVAVLVLAVSVVPSYAQVANDPAQKEPGEKEAGPSPGTELTVRLVDEVPMVFVWVPPGTFRMGSPYSEADRGGDEGPVHEVALTRGFHLGKHEVTQEQWDMVMGTMPWAGHGFVEEGPDHPAVHVSWTDAQAFVEELNASEGAGIYRLPTEAEWEYACRAETTAAWSSGSDANLLPRYAWYRKNAWDSPNRHAHEVGTREPNPWGLHDMHGNVWEWVNDYYSSTYYADGPPVDPAGPGVGTHRVLRGGAIYSEAGNLRSANRNSYGPDTHGYFGFRIVRTVP
ncbi:MAG: formylglycine-generating enzyme family protein [Candidatus Latescibacteria bacterium]|jgi:formylglycine-generating enzyme required for sulfatase activity|nr:formylglycine-generating enzyme family protein [Candidatus Latescibacterota bacterium]